MRPVSQSQKAGSGFASLVVVAVATVAFSLIALLALALSGGRGSAPIEGEAGSAAAYQPIQSASPVPAGPEVLPGSSLGTFRVDCGINSAKVRNSDNLVVSPGVPGAAHHLHEYVGNVSTNAFSTEETLRAAGTSCLNNDLSSYYWPVLRVSESPGLQDGHEHQSRTGDEGVLDPQSVLIEFRGNAVSNVIPLAPNVRTAAGNAHGYSQNGQGTGHVRWSCSGTPQLESYLYPRCPSGEQTVRKYAFPGCWDGRSIDSKDHRSHLTYPSPSGFCPSGTFPVPQLHLEVAYSVPSGADFTIDTFPEEKSSSLSDHAHFINLMNEQLMSEAVACINEGRHCRV